MHSWVHQVHESNVLIFNPILNLKIPGAGKSTLLDLIANRKHVGMWSGEVLINQLPRSEVFNRLSFIYELSFFPYYS